jgi:hypothetical protein
MNYGIRLEAPNVNSYLALGLIDLDPNGHFFNATAVPRTAHRGGAGVIKTDGKTHIFLGR